MAYQQSYGMGPNAQYQYESTYRPQSYGVGGPNDIGGGDLVQTRNWGNQYNMQAPSPYAPVNQGGPGNPNGANNMAKPMLPRFTGNSFQNNKGPAPMQNWGGGPNGRWNGDFSQFANQQQGGYNGSGINPGNMGQSGFGAGQEAQDQDMMQRQQGYRRPMYNDPYQQYGYAGQSQSLGRYQPPMMGNPYDPQGGWLGSGGYSYNIPNSYGSSQWNQFNSTDTANRNFGQTQNQPTLGVNQSVRQGQPQYQSPFASGDPSRSQNYFAYLSTLGQQPQQPRYTQPGAPSQPGPVT